jgi:hypothetical protein
LCINAAEQESRAMESKWDNEIFTIGSDPSAKIQSQVLASR